MPDSLSVEIPIDVDEAPARATLEIYGDRADGVVDFTLAVAPRVKVWPPGSRDPSHLEYLHLEGRHLIGVGSAGHLQGIHLLSKHLRFQDTKRILTGHYYGPQGDDGIQKIATKIFDDEGQETGAPPEASIVLNTSPRPPRGPFTAATASGIIAIVFTASPDLLADAGGPIRS